MTDQAQESWRAVNLWRWRAAISIVLGLVLTLTASPVAAQDDLAIISDEQFCDLVGAEVPTCVEVLEDLGSARMVPETLAALLAAPESTDPTPSADGGDGAAWHAFLAHVVDENAAIEQLLEAAAAAADDFALGRLEGILGQLITRADLELSALDDGAPAECYAEVHEDWRSTIVDLRADAGTTLRGVQARDPALLEDGVQGLARYALRVPRDLDRLGAEDGLVDCR